MLKKYAVQQAATFQIKEKLKIEIPGIFYLDEVSSR